MTPKLATKKREAAAAAAKKAVQGRVELPIVSTTNTTSNGNNNSCNGTEDKTNTDTRDTSPTSSSAGSASISNSSSDSLDSSAGSDSVGIGKRSDFLYYNHTSPCLPTFVLLFKVATCGCQWISVANKGVSWRDTTVFKK